MPSWPASPSRGARCRSLFGWQIPAGHPTGIRRGDQAGHRLEAAAAPSQAAMEVLAVVAYTSRSPGPLWTRCGGGQCRVVSTLVEKGLLEAGRLELPGRPIAYRTGDTFCARLGSTPWMSCPPRPRREEQQTLPLGGIRHGRMRKGGAPWSDGFLQAFAASCCAFSPCRWFSRRSIMES